MTTRTPVHEVNLGAGVRAGFTTVPSNLSLAIGDDSATTRANRRTVASWAGVPVAYLHQAHGAAVHVLPDQQDVPAAHSSRSDDPVAVADAMVTRSAAAAIAVLVADCVPVLLADQVAGVAGVVHAGRRGLVLGVVTAAVATMVDQGTRPDRLRAVIGPAVCGQCYEVPADLQNEVNGVVPGTASTTSWGTPALDLRAGVGSHLRAAGVACVGQVAACTMTDERWFSHRRATGPSRGDGHAPASSPGRFAGVVRLLR